MSPANDQSDSVIEETEEKHDLSNEGRAKQPDINVNVDGGDDNRLNEGSSDLLGKNVDK